jgi:hypothetical protein
MTVLATPCQMLVGFFADDGSLFIKIRQHNGKRLRKSRHTGTRRLGSSIVTGSLALRKWASPIPPEILGWVGQGAFLQRQQAARLPHVALSRLRNHPTAKNGCSRY